MPPPLEAAAAFGVSYRAEGDEDIDFIRDLYISTRAEEVAGTGWPIEAQRAFLLQQCAAQRSHYRTHYAGEWLVIERDRAAVGRLYLADSGGMIALLDIALMPCARGQGIGTAIVADLLTQAAREGRAVEIYVETNNPARRLYDRVGFIEHDTNGVYHRMTWTPPAAIS